MTRSALSDDRPPGTASLDATFGALSDPTRRAIVARLATKEATVMELAQPFPMSLPAVSKHLRVLERCGLLVQARQGRSRVCRLQSAPLQAADEWLATYRRFWEAQLDALSRYLERARVREESEWRSPDRPTKKPRSVSAAGSRRREPASSRRGRGRRG